MEPSSGVAGWAAAEGIPMTVVLPTRTYLTTETDAEGNRFAAVDEVAVRVFVTRLMEGEFGAAQVVGPEIGNECWGIGDFDQGSMNSLEYGRLAADMVTIERTWRAVNPGIETWVTEWSQKGDTRSFDPLQDYGLNTANELIDLVGFIADHDV